MGTRARIPPNSIRAALADRSASHFQSMDENRTCHGVGEHPYHPRNPLFRTYHANGNGHAIVRLGLDASDVNAGCRDLSSGTSGKTTEPSDKTILRCQEAAWVSF